ncbi:putative subunit of the anaphase promoting complex [Entophlyctis helioformis]|nr:putative subunit of the anaphase promoting complex [Entophlyctis helioformis]
MIVANSVSSFKPSSLDMLKSPVRKVRHIAKTPYKVLDAPELQDDFYLNLVDWSAGNQLSVGLGSCVYLWHAKSHAVTKLCDLGQNDHVTSVSWIQRASHLAVGTNKGLVQIWDVERSKLVRQFTGHQGRVGALAWNANVLTSSSRDRSIFNRDTREPRDHVTKLVGHRQEVCGLKWSPSGDILASGGNDNRLFLWDKRQWSSLASFDQHVAAVKAISWSPHEHGLLASGGGTADRCIRFWNTQTLTPISHVDTGSQVCNLAWSKNSNEIVSTHGYSLNQIIVWKYPRMEPVATLTGHTFRVLYLAMSPDGQNIVTGAGDETLRFWNVFAKPKQRGSGTPTGMTVR